MSRTAADEAGHGHNASEMGLTAQLGLIPVQAIIAPTRAACEVWRLADRVGTLPPSKHADLLAVNGDLLLNITVLRDQSRAPLAM